MTLRATCVIAAIVLGCTPTWAQTTPSGANEPSVYVGLFNINADGRSGGSATQTGQRGGADLSGTVYLAPCGSIGAADPGYPVSASATEVWRLVGTVLDLTADEATVHIRWQRLRRDGREETAVPQSVTVTLKRGERSSLEKITVPAAGSCDQRRSTSRSRRDRSCTHVAGSARLNPQQAPAPPECSLILAVALTHCLSGDPGSRCLRP
jgi:hypothetical protein